MLIKILVNAKIKNISSIKGSTDYFKCLDELILKLDHIVKCIEKNENVVELLLKLHSCFLSTDGYMKDFIKLMSYYRKKRLIKNDLISPSFNSQNTIESLLHRIVDAMVHLKNTVPVTNASYASLEKAYTILGNFQKHGHYLPNLSQNKNEHRIGDILLYLRHVNKIVAAVYEYAVMEIVRNVTLKD